MKIKIILMILVIFTMALVPIFQISEIVNAEQILENEIQYTTRNRIEIDSPTDFSSYRGVSAGTGVLGDPYIIEGWEIDMSGDDGSAIYINQGGVYVTIRDCYLYGTQDPDWSTNPPDMNPSGISLYGMTNVLIENCVIENCVWMDNNAIYTFDSTHIQVQNTTISYCGGGINTAGDSSNIDVFNCTVHHTDNVGIFIDGNPDSIDSSVKNCTVYSSMSHAIIINFGNYEVENNTCYDNYPYWALYMSNTVDSKICYNNFTNNGRGLMFGYTSNSYIFNNTIEECDIGIWVSNSQYDHVFHNRFINNIQQYLFGSASAYWWNLTYAEGGGNYWSDYTGTDIYSGVNQDEAGRDYIGDQPYAIGTITDYYPLINASGWVNLTTPKVHNVSVNKTILTFSFYETMDKGVNGNVTVNGTEFNGTWVNNTVYRVNVTLATNLTINTTFEVNMTDFKSDDGYIMEEFTDNIIFRALPPPVTLPIEEPVEPEEELSSYQILQDVLLAIMPFILLLVILIFVIKMIWGIFEEDKKRK